MGTGPNGPPPATPNSRRTSVVVLVSVVAFSLMVGCSSGGGGSDDVASPEPERERTGGGGSRRSSSTAVSSTQPPATDPAAVRPFLDDLLARYDEVVTEIVADPSVVRDRDHPAVEEFLGLFEPGSDFAERSLEGWRANAEADVVLRPVTSGELVTVSHLEGDPTAVSDEELVFARCVEQGYVRLEDGEETERVEGQLLPGEGTAVLVDGRWLLRELSTPPGLRGCTTTAATTETGESAAG